MRLLTAITPHGYGHAAQVLVVLNALMERAPDTELHIATTVPKSFLESRLCCAFTYHSHATDFGLKMDSALDINLEASASAYASQVSLWNSLVEAEMGFLGVVQPDLLLADIPYLPLVAAEKLAIPAVALCSLNWGGIYRYYFGDRPEAARVLERLARAYNSARLFLLPEPSMPMPELDNTCPVGVLARRGVDRSDELKAELDLGRQDRVVLVALGGVQGRLPLEAWPVIPGLHWLVQQSWEVDRSDCHAIEGLNMTFTDILASSDALLGKIGYGTVAECAINGAPLLYIPRADWPEEPYLIDWLERHGSAMRMERDAIPGPDWVERIGSLRTRSLSRSPPASGAEAAADILIREMLQGATV